jgi:hypothetical protein
MAMSYAVVQKELTELPIDALRRAFRHVPGLTALDAQVIGNDAFGILVKDFPLENATAMQGALRGEGIETEIVETAQLPLMPPTKQLRRLGCSEAGLELFDPLGRSFVVAWQHVMLLAAGAVKTSEFVRKVEMKPVLSRGEDDVSNEGLEPEISYKEDRAVHLLLEIVMSRAVLRYSVVADRFDFAYLGGRRTGNVPLDFVAMARDLASFAPHAGLNRGMSSLLEDRDTIFSYPTKNAFLEEIVWLLWRASRPPA